MSNPNPYHVRLAISQYSDQFRAELFTEDLGDTEGDLLPARWEVLDRWAPFLAQGAAASLSPDAAARFVTSPTPNGNSIFVELNIRSPVLNCRFIRVCSPKAEN